MPWVRADSAGRTPRIPDGASVCRDSGGALGGAHDDLVGQELAGVQDALRIERVLDALREREDVTRELEREILLFREPDAVLTRDGAAELERDGEEIIEQRIHARHV